MKKDALRDGWLQPQGVYGFWPCLADGDDLIIYDPALTPNPSPKGRGN